MLFMLSVPRMPITLSVIMLNVIMLNVIMLNVIMLIALCWMSWRACVCVVLETMYQIKIIVKIKNLTSVHLNELKVHLHERK
jgi:hypothetical protein